MKRILTLSLIFLSIISFGYERQNLWPKNKMPDRQDGQVAAFKAETQAPDFKAEKHAMPYLEWYEKPENPNGSCMILISGGGYYNLADAKYVENWRKELTALGVQCVSLVYRTPRPKGLPYYQTGWEDGQRAVRLVRQQAQKRGYDPEKIGTISMSAGSHMAVLLATSSETPAYEKIDATDEISAHINWAIVFAPAYVTTDGDGGPASRQGYGPDVKLSKIFKFDSHTCPMSLHHGGTDKYTPNGSTLIYRELRSRNIPAEVHLYADKGHSVLGFDRGVEFMKKMGFLGPLEPAVPVMDRFASDSARVKLIKENVWPEGKMPCAQDHQCEPFIEWHIPVHKTTDAIQIIYSGGSYERNGPNGFEVAPVRRFLNEKGVTVVTMRYRAPRPKGMPKHITAWQDLQRAIRIVRSEAASRGLDPNRIGIMGSSAGGHLTLMGVTSSLHASYLPIDNIDKLSCQVQWGIAIYPAYSLTDGLEKHNSTGGNDDSAILSPEFSFDLNTAPTLFIHGDADKWAAMNSVKCWEKMRAMGIQSEVHTFVKVGHCFQKEAEPGTGSYNWIDRIWDFLTTKGFVK